MRILIIRFPDDQKITTLMKKIYFLILKDFHENMHIIIYKKMIRTSTRINSINGRQVQK